MSVETARPSLDGNTAFSLPSAPEPTDVSRAVEQVQQWPEFLPPTPDPWRTAMDQLGLAEAERFLEKLLKDIKDWIRHLMESLGHQSGLDPQQTEAWSNGLFTAAIILVLVILLVLVFQLIQGRIMASAARGNRTTKGLEDATGEAKGSARSYLTSARAAYAQGHYDETIHHAYLSSLKWLDEQAWVPYRKDRTNLEYTQELRKKGLSASVQSFQSVVRPFEGVFFGNHPPSPQLAQETLNALEQWMGSMENLTMAEGKARPQGDTHGP